MVVAYTGKVTTLGGNKRIVTGACTGATGTSNVLTIAELSTIDAIVLGLKAMSTATHQNVCLLTAPSTNTCIPVCVDGAGIASTGTVVDYYFVAVGTAA